MHLQTERRREKWPYRSGHRDGHGGRPACLPLPLDLPVLDLDPCSSTSHLSISVAGSAMADALVSIVLEKITEALQQRVELFLGAPAELQKLSSTFQAMRAVLHDAERKQVTDESVRLWLSMLMDVSYDRDVYRLRTLRDVSYDMDDLLDEDLISALERGGGGGRRRDQLHGADDGNKVLPVLANLLSKLIACGYGPRYILAYQVKEIGERLDQIADDKEGYNLSASGGTSSSSGDGGAGSIRLRTSSLVES